MARIWLQSLQSMGQAGHITQLQIFIHITPWETAMSDQTTLSSMQRLQDLVNQIFQTRTITREEQSLLMEIVMEDGQVTPEEKVHIDRVWQGLAQGRIRVVD